jgi:hypothetical protein
MSYLIRDCIQNCYNAREATANSDTDDTGQSDTEYNKEHIECQKDYAKPAKKVKQKCVYNIKQIIPEHYKK